MDGDSNHACREGRRDSCNTIDVVCKWGKGKKNGYVPLDAYLHCQKQRTAPTHYLKGAPDCFHADTVACSCQAQVQSYSEPLPRPKKSMIGPLACVARKETAAEKVLPSLICRAAGLWLTQARQVRGCMTQMRYQNRILRW